MNFETLNISIDPESNNPYCRMCVCCEDRNKHQGSQTPNNKNDFCVGELHIVPA